MKTAQDWISLGIFLALLWIGYEIRHFSGYVRADVSIPDALDVRAR